jgi:NitT/TauT family transport system ATP-binding protein
VLQAARVLPWAPAAVNIADPLRPDGSGRAARRARVEAAADRVALAREELGKFPVELSGGMKQRTAIARALVAEPDFLYFDEPFTALDQALKRRMQDLVIEASRTSHFAALFITHDLMEAARIAHRIAVLDINGRGIVGERALAGEPGSREDVEIFRTVQRFLKDDPLFRHIDDVDERRVA